MTTNSEALRAAIAMHQAGQLPQAEQIYRLILQSEPSQPDALHLLGVVALQSGRPEQAISYIGQAIAAAPAQPMYHNNLGKAYQTRGSVSEARASYEQALAIDPSFVLAHFNLGTLYETSQPAEAQRHFERAIALAPDHALAHNNLGNVLRSQGKLEEAIAEYRRALACQADCADALANLCEATGHLEQTARRERQSAEAQMNLGSAYLASKNWEGAIRCFEEALRLEPNCGDARCDLGRALQETGEAAAAALAFAETLRRHPDHVAALVNSSALAARQGRAAEALELSERALAIKPDAAEAHFHRSRALQSLRRFHEAVQALREAVRCRREFPEAHADLTMLCLKNTSHDHRCIFIHVPKNGGTSIKEVLDMPGGGHPPWQFYARGYPQLWERYTIFAVVRNPWDRAVSAFHHAKMRRSHWHDEQMGLHPDYRLLHDKSFEECVSILFHQRERLRHESWHEQSFFIVDPDAPDQRIVVDHLLRFESLTADFAELCRKLGIDCQSLPTVNTSQRSRAYREYYNDETRKMIENVYRADIDNFGYSF
jgi:tetratricopeptide (TPR) repeat protein